MKYCNICLNIFEPREIKEGCPDCGNKAIIDNRSDEYIKDSMEWMERNKPLEHESLRKKVNIQEYFIELACIYRDQSLLENKLKST
jgi:predicted  nucleic acid-binding Zn-ribbon protein